MSTKTTARRVRSQYQFIKAHPGSNPAAPPVFRPKFHRLCAVDMPELYPLRRPGVLNGLTPLRLVP